MNNEELAQEIIEKIDFTDLVYEMSQLAVAAMTGQEIEKTTIKVDLEVPKPIANVIKKVAEAAGTSTEESFSALANQGLNNILNNQVKKVKEVEKQKEPDNNELDDLAGKMGIDMSNFNEQFGKLGNLVNQLQGLSEMFNDAGLTDQTKKNNI